MSVKALSAVFEDSRAEGAAFVVLLAMADWSDHVGRCYPSYTQIMRKARLKSRASVVNAIEKLERLGELRRESGGHPASKQDDDVPPPVARQRRNVYRILLLNRKPEVDHDVNHLGKPQVDQQVIHLQQPEVVHDVNHLEGEVDHDVIGDRSRREPLVVHDVIAHIRNSPSVPVSRPSEERLSAESTPTHEHAAEKDAPAAARKRTLVDDYYDGYRLRFGKPPVIVPGKDGKLLKDLADQVGEDAVRRMLLEADGRPGWFFTTPHPFINSTGYDVGVFYSCWNVLQLTQKPAKTADAMSAQLALREELKARGTAEIARLDQQAREALVKASPQVLELIRREVVSGLARQFPGIDERMTADRWAHCVKGAMVREVVDFVIREKKTAAEFVAMYAEKASAA